MKEFICVAGLMALSMLACGPESKFSGTAKYSSIPKAESTSNSEPKVEPTSNSEPVIEPIPKSEPLPTVEPDKNTTIYIDNRAEAVTEPFIVPEGTLRLKFDKEVFGTANDLLLVKPSLAIYFVIDRSSSMGDQLNAVKTGIQQFSDNLLNAGFTAKFGAVAFQDPIDSRFSLGDLSAFKNYLSNGLNGLGTSSVNDDYPEGGLGAITEAALRLSTEVNDPSVTPVIVLVTDALGHMGGTGYDTSHRDCSFGPFLTNMNSTFGKRIKFFYSVSPDRVVYSVTQPCSKWHTTDQEYDELLQNLQSNSADFRGQKLSWPFDQRVLANQLPKLLTEKIVSKSLTCSLTRASFVVDGAAYKTWNTENLTKGTDGTLVMNEAFSNTEVESMRNASLGLSITRCCDETPSATTCLKDNTQLVTFKIAP